MMSNDSHHPEPRPAPAVRSDASIFQFSLATVFAVTTATALILALFFSVGRLMGMSSMDVVSQGLVRFFYTGPVLLVWVVGLTLAIRHRRSYGLPATLTLIALGFLILSTLINQLVQMMFIYSVNSQQISGEWLTWVFTVSGIIHVSLSTICWVLILIAVFGRRGK